MNIIALNEIDEWIDCGQTALCPRCGVDSLLPGFWGMSDVEFLREMNCYWFKLSTRLGYNNLD
ncbi:MAG: hypothetical protein WC523_04485 [Patescibacteria group bacterium]